MFFHGGGMVAGTPRQNDFDCATLARALGVPVFSVDYRLAPEHPYPAAMDDAVEAWHTLQLEAEWRGIDPQRIAISGESAGGGIAAALSTRLRDEGAPLPVAQALVYPMLDDKTTLRRELDPVAYPVWCNKSNRFGWSAYLGRERVGTEGVSAHAAPARAENLRGLPPTWIGVGTADLFVDEDRDYADRLRVAGVVVDYEEVEGAFHGFPTAARGHELSRAFRDSRVAFLARHL